MIACTLSRSINVQKRLSIVFGDANSLKSSYSRDCLSGPRGAAQHGDPFHWHCRWQIARAAYSEVRDHSKHRLRRAIRRLERDSMLLHSNQLTSTSTLSVGVAAAPINCTPRNLPGGTLDRPFVLPAVPLFVPFLSSLIPFLPLPPLPIAIALGPAPHPRHCFTPQRIS